MSESLENIKREQYDVKMVEDSKLESSNDIKIAIYKYICLLTIGKKK
jgi:hypothetical protein